MLISDLHFRLKSSVWNFLSNSRVFSDQKATPQNLSKNGLRRNDVKCKLCSCVVFFYFFRVVPNLKCTNRVSRAKKVFLKGCQSKLFFWFGQAHFFQSNSFFREKYKPNPLWAKEYIMAIYMRALASLCSLYYFFFLARGSFISSNVLSCCCYNIRYFWLPDRQSL